MTLSLCVWMCVCVCLTSASQLSNDRRHMRCTVCVSTCLYGVCVLAKRSATHEFRIHFILPEVHHQSTFQPVIPCVYLLYSVFNTGSDLQWVCTGSSSDLDLGTCSTHTLWPAWPPVKLLASHTCEPVCSPVCVFPLIPCLWNEEICYYSQMKRKKGKGSGGKKRKSKTKQILLFSLIYGSTKAKQC